MGIKIKSILAVLVTVLCFSSCKTTVDQNVSLDVLRGRWYIAKIYEEKIPTKELAFEPYVEFYMRDSHMRGNTGCNVMDAGYYQKKGQINSLIIGKITTRDNVCAEMSVQDKIIKALAKVVAFGRINTDKVYLLDADGLPVITLKK